MTDGEHSEARDAELLRALQRNQRTTTGRHDAAVLEAAKAVASARRQERRRTRSTRLRIAASLAAVVVAGVGLLWLVPASNGPPAGDPRLRGERAAVSPSNGASLAAPPGAFEWPSQPGAAQYLLVLLDAGARPIWRSAPSPSNSIAVPDEVARRLRDGGTYLWTVEIRYAGRVREIGPFWFEITPE